MAAAACICTSDKCGHNGQPCGKPVEYPVEAALVDNAPAALDPVVGEWIETGLCEECWKRNPPPKLDPAKVAKLFGE